MFSDEFGLEDELAGMVEVGKGKKGVSAENHFAGVIC